MGSRVRVFMQVQYVLEKPSGGALAPASLAVACFGLWSLAWASFTGPLHGLLDGPSRRALCKVCTVPLDGPLDGPFGRVPLDVVSTSPLESPSLKGPSGRPVGTAADGRRIRADAVLWMVPRGSCSKRRLRLRSIETGFGCGSSTGSVSACAGSLAHGPWRERRRGGPVPGETVPRRGPGETTHEETAQRNGPKKRPSKRPRRTMRQRRSLLDGPLSPVPLWRPGRCRGSLSKAPRKGPSPVPLPGPSPRWPTRTARRQSLRPSSTVPCTRLDGFPLSAAAGPLEDASGWTAAAPLGAKPPKWGGGCFHGACVTWGPCHGGVVAGPWAFAAGPLPRGPFSQKTASQGPSHRDLCRGHHLPATPPCQTSSHRVLVTKTGDLVSGT
mmetsp:Transcript_8908/g.31338  ORF Transcript_8908/g.31338 Transcript_8908/m.31338 type:complete len:384 (-) Transcript_8908:566-1717(-)